MTAEGIVRPPMKVGGFNSARIIKKHVYFWTKPHTLLYTLWLHHFTLYLIF